MKMFFCIDRHRYPTPSEQRQPGGGRYITHAQRPVFYAEENFIAEYGYETEERCRQELRKMERLHERFPSTMPIGAYELYIEEHDVGEA